MCIKKNEAEFYFLPIILNINEKNSESANEIYMRFLLKLAVTNRERGERDRKHVKWYFELSVSLF